VLMRWRRAPLLIVGAFAAFAVVSYALPFTVVVDSNPTLPRNDMGKVLRQEVRAQVIANQ